MLEGVSNRLIRLEDMVGAFTWDDFCRFGWMWWLRDSCGMLLRATQADPQCFYEAQIKLVEEDPCVLTTADLLELYALQKQEYHRLEVSAELGSLGETVTNAWRKVLLPPVEPEETVVEVTLCGFPVPVCRVKDDGSFFGSYVLEVLG